MDRRTFILGGAAAMATPIVATAQAPAKTHRVGILWVGRSSTQPLMEALSDFGYVQGKNLIVDFRQATPAELAAQASDVVRLNPTVVVTQGTQATRAAMNATRTIPIVMVGAADPVATGIVASLHHPGANVTGSTDMRPTLTAKRVQLLGEVRPTAKRLGALFNPTEPAVTQEWADTEAAARALGLATLPLETRTPDEISNVFARLNSNDVLVVFVRIFTGIHRARIIELAATHKVPAMYGGADFARGGGLMGLGANYPDLLRRTAILIDKILKGAKPADLPIEQPSKFELVVNLQTAKALGLTIPPSLLLRADQVIE